jgi:serine/threonine-protein kinase
MIGQNVGHYTVLQELGRGGMGQVYLAQDTSLDRKVALKFLPEHVEQNPTARLRFLREAQCAAAIDHPYICKIYEIGEFEGKDFISMEYVRGQTLKDEMAEYRLPLEKVLQIGSEIAEALESAHKEGIMHRDLKPSNVMFAPDGHVKVMDFGLAKRVLTAPNEEQDPALTAEGSIAGTLSYMSPEQLQRHPVDARSDTFSFGVILYEMLSGVHPFQKLQPLETASAILKDDPSPLSRYNEHIPELLQHTVGKMLAKDLDARYQVIHEVRTNLAQLLDQMGTTQRMAVLPKLKALALSSTTLIAVMGIILILGAFLSLHLVRRGETGPSDKPTEAVELALDERPRIAVLPFANLSRREEDEAFSEGLTDSLITRLANVQALSVISYPSVMYFKGKDMPIQQIARQLKLNYIVHGSFLKSGDQCRVTVQLIRVSDDSNLWAEDYRLPWTDIFTIQDQVSEKVVERVNVTLGPEEKRALKKAPTENIGAYEAYMHGRFFWNKRTRESLEKAVEYFRQAIKEDPESALVYAGLADAYHILGATGYGGLPPNEVMPKARQAALKALAIDDTSAEAHASLANILMSYDWDWEGAGKHFNRAIEINPGFSTAHHWYGLYLAAKGDLGKALEEIKQAQKLDPMSPSTNAALARCYYYRREYNQAIEQYERALELEPDFSPAHLGLGLTYAKKYEVAKTRVDQTSLFFKSVMEFRKGLAVPIDVFAFIESLVGRTEEVEKWRLPPFVFAMTYAILGNTSQTFEWLDKAVEERSEYLVYLKVDPIFDSIRSDPRFGEILQQVRLSP